MRAVFFILVFFLAFSLVARNHEAVYFSYKPEHVEVQKAISELRLTTANSQLTKLIAAEPNNAAPVFLNLYNAFYKVLVQLDESYVADFNAKYEAYLKINQNIPASSPYKSYTKGSALLMKAIVAGAFNKYFDAATGFRSAYLEITSNQAKFPNFIANLKELGALEAMIGSLPAQYHWVIHALGLDGTIAGGINKLEQYMAKCKLEPIIEQQQAAIYLTLIQFNFGDKQKAYSFYKSYAKDLENNLMQCYVLAYIGGKSGHNSDALHTLEIKPHGSDYEQIAYLIFLKAEFMLHQLNFEAAFWYKKYLVASKTKGSAKESYVKLAIIALLQNDTEKYLLYKGMAEKYQSHIGSEQKLNNADLAKRIFMNQNLVKARLLYDGGYYEQSLTKLKQIEFNNLPSAYQKTEYYYRFARVYHDLGDFSHAIKMYQECLTLGSNMNTYFTPNTCLQLGLIYSKLGYPDLAKKYFIQVSNYSGYDYEDSIKQKAKAGLNQIR